ncbi:hypothetical protein BSL78_27777 [Apostichopus japonicus]|uniref:Uncharacterized protein n=1 Tax=Stichopus japonicus TaxID=307972 RepID=A0A2G8JI58_STIJA|nr:hypothetical protein BSL78_27777 [Apostichopus japonicus]
MPNHPQEAKERLKAEQGASSTHVFKTPDQRKLEELLVEVDMAARSGMKFASVLMLSAEVLMRHHQQLPEDSSQVSRDEAGQLLLLLGPLVRLAYDQFARVATRSVRPVDKTSSPPSIGLRRRRRTECWNYQSSGRPFCGLLPKETQEEVPEGRLWPNQNSDPPYPENQTLPPEGEQST